MSAEPKPPADEVTERLMHLRALFAEMDDRIQREAEERAAKLIEDAEARARLAAMEARAEVQRERDLVAELRKRIAVTDRMRDELDNGRRALAAALGESPGALPLSYFADRAVAAIEARRGSDAR